MTARWPSDVALLIPAYRAVSSLARFLPDLLQTVPASNILVVDDGSDDNTGELCKTLGVECRSLSRNRGKGRALAAGFDRLAPACRFIVTMDADGQHAIADLPKFLDAMRQEPDAGIIIGKRTMRPGVMPFSRICSNRLTSLALSLLAGRRVLDSQSGYRAYNTDFLRSITIEWSRFEMESEVILKAAKLGYPVLFVGVQTLYCSDQSHIAHIPDTLRWIRAVVSVWWRLRSTPRQNQLS
jgi:glycosyltransferase involved in cell wall biosynthesis